MAQEETLVTRIERATIEAMKARDAARTSALRMAKAALQNRAIEKRAPLDDGDAVQVLGTLAKQRREAIEQFRAGGRADLAEKEEAELLVLQEFLPEALSEEQVRQAVHETVAAVGAAGSKDMGKVMSALMPRVKGRADGKLVNALVREALGGGA
ncbi:MAG: GatB/YqeY domain-containing protein [Deltaproteobacteria bacterium]|nr:GatB/YqeY domain-containing protein [Deltaproteobacteria bacterium]